MASTADKAVMFAVEILVGCGMEKVSASENGSHYLRMPEQNGVLRVSNHGGQGRPGGACPPICGRVTFSTAEKWDQQRIKKRIATALGYYLLKMNGYERLTFDA